MSGIVTKFAKLLPSLPAMRCWLVHEGLYGGLELFSIFRKNFNAQNIP